MRAAGVIIITVETTLVIDWVILPRMKVSCRYRLQAMAQGYPGRRDFSFCSTFGTEVDVTAPSGRSFADENGDGINMES